MYQRNTLQRKLILETVRMLKNHPTADEVYSVIVKDYPNISRTTVYRGLRELCEAGQLKHIELPGGADHYDHTCHEHYHIRCSICGHVEDVEMDYISNLVDQIKSDHGYLISDHDIVFKGICPNCQKNKIIN